MSSQTSSISITPFLTTALKAASTTLISSITPHSTTHPALSLITPTPTHTSIISSTSTLTSTHTSSAATATATSIAKTSGSVSSIIYVVLFVLLLLATVTYGIVRCCCCSWIRNRKARKVQEEKEHKRLRDLELGRMAPPVRWEVPMVMINERGERQVVGQGQGQGQAQNQPYGVRR